MMLKQHNLHHQDAESTKYEKYGCGWLKRQEIHKSIECCYCFTLEREAWWFELEPSGGERAAAAPLLYSH
jgi:hypothetical protein